LQVERTAFEEIRLDEPELDPVLCVKAQNAVMSPHPGDLVAVKPVLYYDLDRYKTIQHVGLALDLDSRLDLLNLSPNEFEVLIRELFEAMGLKSCWSYATVAEPTLCVLGGEHHGRGRGLLG